VGRFAVVFGLIWLAWINGAVYHDLHGRAEGLTRTYVFLQMSVLALLAGWGSGSRTGGATSTSWQPAGCAPVYRPVSAALGVAAVLALLLGWLAPPPWLQILLLTLMLLAVWLYGILTWFSFTHHE